MSEKLVTVAAFNTPLEAHMVRSVLEGEGIQSVLFNEQIAGVHLPLAAATGGVQVRVLASDVERAEAILAEEMAADSEVVSWDEDEGAEFGAAEKP